MGSNICKKTKGSYFNVSQWPSCSQISAKSKGNLISVGLTANKWGGLPSAQRLTWWLEQWLHLC